MRQRRDLARAAPRAAGAGKTSDICVSRAARVLRAPTSQLAAAPHTCYQQTPAFLTEVAAWFWGQTPARLGSPQPLRGAPPSSRAALEDSELRGGDISSQAASSCQRETMEQRVTRKEQLTVMHPALSSVPFGSVKISDVFQSWVHQTFSCFCANYSCYSYSEEN